MRHVLSDVFSSGGIAADSRLEKKKFPILGETIHALGSEINFVRNLEIFGEGELPRLTYIVITGAVRAYKVLSDGRRQIFNFYYPGEVFGFDAGIGYAFSAEAVVNSSVRAIKRDLLIAATEHQTDLAIELWQLISLDLERARNLSMTLGCMGAQEKVLDFLLQVAQNKRGRLIADLLMSRADVADHLGLTIETVSRALAQLETNLDIRMLSSREILVHQNAESSGDQPASFQSQKYKSKFVESNA